MMIVEIIVETLGYTLPCFLYIYFVPCTHVQFIFWVVANLVCAKESCVERNK